MEIKVSQSKGFKGIIRVPGDKSISHRSIIIGSIAEGKTRVKNFLESEDCNNTILAFEKMGVKIEKIQDAIEINGVGLDGLQEPEGIIDVGNSGTGIRLLMGIAAAFPHTTFLTGDSSILKRPMARVIDPLIQMGAKIMSRVGGKAPIAVQGGCLKPIKYKLPVASAQVKSAILLAGLFTEGKTEVIEPTPSRSHTELMLKSFGAEIMADGEKVSIIGRTRLLGKDIEIPGDISSAAFFIVGALVIPGSHLVIENVGLNPTRTGILDVLKEMGGDIKINNHRMNSLGEYIGDLEIRTSELRGVEIGGGLIPRLIDEIPIITVAAAFADGKTIIRDAQELRVKESDRIKTTASEMSKFGIKITEQLDGLTVIGGGNFKGGVINSHMDHRIAMAAVIAGLASKGETTVLDTECISTSFPSFNRLVNKVNTKV